MITAKGTLTIPNRQVLIPQLNPKTARKTKKEWLSCDFVQKIEKGYIYFDPSFILFKELETGKEFPIRVKQKRMHQMFDYLMMIYQEE